MASCDRPVGNNPGLIEEWEREKKEIQKELLAVRETCKQLRLEKEELEDEILILREDLQGLGQGSVEEGSELK